MPTANVIPNASASNFDLPSLHLLRSEISGILNDGERHLNQFNDDSEQYAALMDSVDTLRQLTQVFRLINLEEAAVLASTLADGFAQLYDEHDNADDDLMMHVSEGMMLLGRYVEFVLLKQTIAPALLLPIINQLREDVGQHALALDDLSDSKSSSLAIANPEQNFQSLRDIPINGQDIGKLATAYRAGLSVALTAKQPPTNPEDLQKLAAMQAACTLIAQHTASLFWQAVAASVTDLAQTLPLNKVQKRALIFAEQQFHDYLPVNDARFADLVQFASLRDGDLAKAVQQKARGNTVSETQLADMRRFLLGPNFEVTDTLNSLIQQEIEAIKTASDTYTREQNLNAPEQALNEMAERLDNLHLVFKMLNLPAASDALAAQRDAVKGWTQASPEDYDNLLASLMVAENASIELARSHTPGASLMPLYNKDISLHQLDTAYSTLIKESRASIAAIETAFNDYLAAAEPDITHLANVPALLRQVAGACQFLNLPQTAKMLKRGAEHSDAVLQRTGTTSPERLARMADVIMAADYYLESLEAHKPASPHAVKVGQNSLRELMAA